MNRFTFKDAERSFETLARALGKSTDWSQVGAWRLDYNATYGGCKIEEKSNAAGRQRSDELNTAW